MIAALVPGLVDVSHSCIPPFLFFSFVVLSTGISPFLKPISVTTRLSRYTERHSAKVPERRPVPRFFWPRAPETTVNVGFLSLRPFFLVAVTTEFGVSPWSSKNPHNPARPSPFDLRLPRPTPHEIRDIPYLAGLPHFTTRERWPRSRDTG